MHFDILTLFPEMVGSYLDTSILGRAREKNLVSFSVHNIRDFAADKHRKTDDTPYGGGAGMVMKVEPVYRAVQALGVNMKVDESPSADSRIILLSAKGNRFRQEDARRLTVYDRVVLICGRYEGVDERVAEYIADEELSIGDFVLTGGELPALAVVDAVSRLVPGVLGNDRSAEIESHSTDGYLEYPQYTKPETFNGWSVPETLLSGNHSEIDKWRRSRSGMLH